MPGIHISAADWVVLVVYLAGITAIGLIVSRRVSDTSHYFLGGRSFNKWIMMGQSFGTGTHAEMPVSLAGAVFSMGASAIWYQWKNLFVTPFYWLIAPLFRRVRRTTMAEFVEDRYASGMGAIYTVFALAFLCINMASMLKGAAKVISQAVGGDVPVNGLVVAMTAVFMLYSFFGGLVSAAFTDFFQGFLIIALSFMLIPLGWADVGGAAGMRAALPPQMFSLSVPHGIGPWFIFMLTINGLIGTFAMPHYMAAVGTGKDEHACRSGMFYGTFIKRFCTIGWAVVGLMVAAAIARGAFGVHTLGEPEEAFGFACRHLLFPGGVGLLIASVLATNMAGCSAFMVDCGALFTRNLYRKYLAPSKADSHYLWVGRISGVLITLISVLYAVFLIQRVLYSFLLTETMATFVGISVLGGILWRRATRWGAIASIAAAIGADLGLYALRHQRLDSWDPGVFLGALLTGTAVFVVVSLLTSREPQKRLDSFFARLETPSDGTSTDIVTGPPSPEEKRAHAEAGRQLILLNVFHLRKGAAGAGILRAYSTDLRGFGLGCMIVAALVALLWLLLRL
jgi:Na+/proline symporter